MKIRDRIKELRRVRAGELRPHPKNWRTHPAAQQDALRGVLAEIGYADALLGQGTARRIAGTDRRPPSGRDHAGRGGAGARGRSRRRRGGQAAGPARPVGRAWPRRTTTCWPSCWRTSRRKTTPSNGSSTGCWRRRKCRRRRPGKPIPTGRGGGRDHGGLPGRRRVPRRRPTARGVRAADGRRLQVPAVDVVTGPFSLGEKVRMRAVRRRRALTPALSQREREPFCPACPCSGKHAAD